MPPSFRSLVCAAGLAALPVVATAHPGHAGHEVTWDLSHLAAHPLATLGCLLILGGCVWLGSRLISHRTRRRPRNE